jgi:predicted lipoprotein with Yx(FWY)xxD motif
VSSVAKALDSRLRGNDKPNRRASSPIALAFINRQPEKEIHMIRRTLLFVAALAFAGGASMSALAAGAPVKTVDGVFVNAAGMTLYTFDKDTAGSGKSTCNGPCAANWPPLMAGADAKPEGDWTVITRDDGGKQWAYKGKPVYLWVKDQKPGDRSGDGFNNAWRLARP